jgi:hypothetical protein
MPQGEALRGLGDRSCDPAISITVSEAVHRANEPDTWDDFAQRCATHYECAYTYLRAWALKNRFRLRLFEIFMQEDGPPKKIGQCAVGVGRATGFFRGELQLLTSHSRFWTSAMTALLSHLGPGHYSYGSYESTEKSREEDLKQISAVTIESVRPLVVHAVDFSRWPTWDDYWRAISSNSRRNARRAELLIPDLSIAIRRGHQAALDVPTLLSLRAATYRRKGLAFEPWRAGLSGLGMILTCPQYVLTAVVSGQKRALAAIFAVQFGPHVYYANGGSQPDNDGAAWYLTLSMLRRTYEQNPRTGKFIMGCTGCLEQTTHDEKISGGLLRFRQSCRVSAYPTSVVSFSYGL